jgi:hypothetical protein
MELERCGSGCDICAQHKKDYLKMHRLQNFDESNYKLYNATKKYFSLYMLVFGLKILSCLLYCKVGRSGAEDGAGPHKYNAAPQFRLIIEQFLL